MRKRIATCMAMACISSFLFAACENGGTGNSKNEVKVWTAPSYVKVLQDTDLLSNDKSSTESAWKILIFVIGFAVSGLIILVYNLLTN